MLARSANFAASFGRSQPDVLHTHTAKAGAAGRIAALLAGGARPAAVVHTYHGHVLRGYFGGARRPSSASSSGRSPGPASQLVAVSPQVRDDLVALRIAPAAKFTVIPYGFDLTAHRVGQAPSAHASKVRSARPTTPSWSAGSAA